MKNTLVAVAALLSLNAIAASIPPETHTVNGLSIFNENGVMWSRGEAAYDAGSDSLLLVQYAKATNGSWTKNSWMAPCDRKKTGLVRQVRGMWTSNARTYDMTAEHTVVDDSAGVTAFKTALCPAGKLKGSTGASPSAAGAASAGPIRLTIPAKDTVRGVTSVPVELTGKVAAKVSREQGVNYKFITDKEWYTLAWADENPDLVRTLKQIAERDKTVKLTGNLRTLEDGYTELDWSKPITVISE